MKRSSERLAITVPARITWKDASGAVRFASVMTRDVSEVDEFALQALTETVQPQGIVAICTQLS